MILLQPKADTRFPKAAAAAIDEVWVERSEVGSEIAQTALARLDGKTVHIVDDARTVPPANFAAGKRRLVLQRHRSTFLQGCPAGTGGLVCCNYLVMNFASNCPYDCSYCFLQDYIANNSTLKAFTNVEDGLAEISALAVAHPKKNFRLGTGELADSLALDPLTGLSSLLVPHVASLPNVLLELKTKSDCVDELLRCDPRGRVVVSWSVNARKIVDEDEHGTANLEQRLFAARRVMAAGYQLGFHFDPLIEFDGWEEGYRQAVEEIFADIDPARVAFVSLGSLRLSPQLSAAIRRRDRTRNVLASELVECADGKSRVWQGLRLRMYRHVVRELQRVSASLPIYLCMEGPGVWQRVMGDVPQDRDLGAMLARGATW